MGNFVDEAYRSLKNLLAEVSRRGFEFVVRRESGQPLDGLHLLQQALDEALIYRREGGERVDLLVGIARIAIRVTRQGAPLDDSGVCPYCDVTVVKIGGGSATKPHGEQCMWEILRQMVEEYNETYGGLHDKLKKG